MVCVSGAVQRSSAGRGKMAHSEHPGITGQEVGLREAGVSTGGKKMDSACCSKMFAVNEKMAWAIV